MSADAIRTERLLLVPSDETLARAEDDHRDAFFRQLGVRPPAHWPPELNDDNTIAYNLQMLSRGGEQAVGWWQWYVVLESDDDRALVGVGGFKGPPDDDGYVEAGYSLLDEHRGRGYATEALLGLCDWAAQQGARRVIVQTLPELQASIRTAQRAGFDGPMKGLEPGAVMLVRDLHRSEAAGEDLRSSRS